MLLTVNLLKNIFIQTNVSVEIHKQFGFFNQNMLDFFVRKWYNRYISFAIVFRKEKEEKNAAGSEAVFF